MNTEITSEIPAMSNMVAAVRKSDGMRWSDMSEAQIEALLTGMAKAGAGEALKSIGLDDTDAPADIRDIRDALRVLRMTRTNARTAFKATITIVVKGGTRLLKWVIFMWLANHLISSDIAKGLVGKVLDMEKF